MTHGKTIHRWYHPVSDWFILGLLVIPLFLALSEHFCWFAFNETKGWTVLIACGGVGAGVLVLLIWYAGTLVVRVARTYRMRDAVDHASKRRNGRDTFAVTAGVGRRVQFGVRSLLLLVFVISIQLGWLALERHRAARQTAAIQWVRQLGGSYSSRNGPDPFTDVEPGPWVLEKLWELLGDRFFVEMDSVRLEGEKVETISRVAALREIRKVTLIGTSVTDLSPLAGLPQLESLIVFSSRPISWDEGRPVIMRTPVTDLSPLAEIPNLEQLVLDYTAVSDITPLRALTNLRHLELTHSPVSDLSPLAGHTSLQWLDLWGSQVSDLSPLAGLTDLEKLGLQQTAVSDLSPLAGLTRLKWLNLHAASSVTDLKPLTRLTAMEYLDVTRTPVSDLSPLSGMSKLAKLELAVTRVTDLSPLAGLTSLEQLNVAGLTLDLAPLIKIEGVKIVLGGHGRVVVPDQMQRRILYTTGYRDVVEP